MAGGGTKRIIDLTEAAETQSGDYIAIDSTGRGTRKLPAGFMATAEDLSEEQTARQQADTTLDGKITAEAQAREEAVADLKSDLDEIKPWMRDVYDGFNLHDDSTDSVGYLLADGSVQTDSRWKTTDFIEIHPPCYVHLYTTEAQAMTHFRCLYDEDKTVSDYQTDGVRYLHITDASIKYIRVSHQNVSNLCISEGCVNIADTTLATKKCIMSDDASQKLEAIKVTTGKNLLNSELLSIGAYTDPTEELRFAAAWVSTPSIEVASGGHIYATKYTGGTATPMAMFYCNGYDADYNFVSQITNGDYDVIIPQGIKYIRFCNNTINLATDTLQVEYNSRTSYEPYTEIYSFLGAESDKWQGKKWVCVGDSLTEINARTNMHYFDYVAEKTNISVVNMGVSGTGYARGGDYNFYTRIANVPTDADVITIFGSGNDLDAGLNLGDPDDSVSDNTLCGYINGTIDLLLSTFLTAGKVLNLGIVTPTPWIGSTPSTPNNNMEQYCDAIIEICRRKGVPCLDLYHCSNLFPDNATFRQLAYSKDEGNGVHPDETGHKLIAPRFKGFLETLLL